MPPQSVTEPELQLSKGYSSVLSLTGALLEQPTLLRCLGHVYQPLTKCRGRFAAHVFAVQAAGDTLQPRAPVAPLARSPLSDTTRYAVRLPHGYPMKDPKPSEARGNIFNGSANFPAFGIP